MKIEYLSILKSTNLFKGFSFDELISVFNEGQYTISYYGKGSIIHMENQRSWAWDVILKGEAMVQKIDEKGSILNVTQFAAGENMGGNLLFSRHPHYPMSVFAKSDTIILHIQRDLVLQLCQENKVFLLEFLTSISDKTTILTSKIKNISMKTIREIIIDFLNFQYKIQKSHRITLNMTKKELAEDMGIQRTSLSRELQKMRSEGLVSYDAHTVTIQDLSIIRIPQSF